MICNTQIGCYKKLVFIMCSDLTPQEKQIKADQILTAFLRIRSQPDKRDYEDFEVTFLKLFLYLTDESVLTLPGNNPESLSNEEKRTLHNLLHSELN
jgi:hypothetical protein